MFPDLLGLEDGDTNIAATMLKDLSHGFHHELEAQFTHNRNGQFCALGSRVNVLEYEKSTCVYSDWLKE